MQRLTTFLLLAGITFTAQAQTNCGLLHDSNANGFVDIEDFLSILGLFGDQDSDGDGLYDSLDNCIDSTACNYLSVDGEFCSYPDAIGDCNGNCPTDANGDGVCDVFVCGDLLPYQGYDYTTVLIGEQCWFAENIRNEFYKNGEPIPSNLSNDDWNSADNPPTGAVAVYGEDDDCVNWSPDIDACDPSQSLNEYGRLYNWYAVDDARGLCPNGWHVPTNGEWTLLIDHLGGNFFAQNQLKADYGWYDDGNGTNSSGFSGLPGGFRNSNGNSREAGREGIWWSSSPDGEYARFRSMVHTNVSISNNISYRRSGFSVRCIQDSE